VFFGVLDWERVFAWSYKVFLNRPGNPAPLLPTATAHTIRSSGARNIVKHSIPQVAELNASLKIFYGDSICKELLFLPFGVISTDTHR
jgi:hypothetical protein